MIDFFQITLSPNFKLKLAVLIMTVKKVKNGTWTVGISDGFHPVTQKRIRIIRKGLKTKKEALELEQYIRVVELREK